jgi:phosphatidylglycerophosphatase A
MRFLLSLGKDISYIIGTFFGVGLIPIASGTCASIVIAILWFLVPDYYFYNSIEKTIFYDNYFYLLIGILIFSWISVYICTTCEKYFGHDAHAIVIDEVAGYLITILFLPKTTMVAVYALFLFRVFDVAKPWFIDRLQRLPKGWGIMADDIAAGVVSNIILQGLYIIKPQFFY